MVHRLAVTIALSFAFASPAAAGPAQDAPCRLTVGWAPSEHQGRGPDGEPTGLSLDLLRLVADEARCALALVERGEEALAQALRDGAVDVVAEPGEAVLRVPEARTLALSPTASVVARADLPAGLARRLAEAAGRVVADGRAELVESRHRAVAETEPGGGA